MVSLAFFGIKSMAWHILYENFDFFPNIPPILKLDVRKVFGNFLPKYGESPFYKLIMNEVSKYLIKKK